MQHFFSPTPWLAFCLCICLPAFGATDNKWYDQGFEKILSSKIVTATRSQSTIKDAPGVTTVFTAEDIERMGLRSIKELLERTTGFFVTRQLTGASIGSRGYLADTDQFLLLVDGHNMNSIVSKGMGDSFLFPGLEHVKQVEIVRGPGSTLWGSDASLGIIHIITKSGAEIDGLKATANYSDEDKARHFNLQFGETITDDIQVMASFTAAESDGFPILDGYGNPIPSQNSAPFIDSNGNELTLGNWDKMENSYQLYAKAQVRDVSLKAGASNYKINRPYSFFQLSDEPAFNERKHYFLNITQQKQLQKNMQLETRFFSNLIQNTQVKVSPQYSPDAITGRSSESSDETSLGLEMILRWQLFETHQLLIGGRYTKTEFSPVVEQHTYPINSSPAATGATTTYYVVPDTADHNSAIFIEDSWQIVPNKLTAIVGIRWDKNSLREDNDIILPRFALNWNMTQNFQVKYSYNTGYIRPSVAIGFLQQEHYFERSDSACNIPGDGCYRFGVDQSQEVSSHDLQFNYSNNNFKSHLNFYYTDVKNPFQILYEPATVDGVKKLAFYVNGNTITTKGVELELAYRFLENFDVYINSSFVDEAKISKFTGSARGIDYDFRNTTAGFAEGTYAENGTILGYPKVIVNTGTNWNFSQGIKGNLNLRYWDKMLARLPDSTGVYQEKTLGSEYFIDFNLSFTNVLGSNFDFSVFAKNLLDNNDSETYMDLYSYSWLDQGRRIGTSVAYKF